ncbi:CoA transferase [Agrobacterium tumefaciens]|uniref:CoA transferase n=1 Tax=Agrobacterium tumefaciens TaxID=358 RepID=UPI0021D01ED1|nr:CoA transferase [Agrobacterium tumefaciens]
MTQDFDREINEALGREFAPAAEVSRSGDGELPSCFRVSDLAEASVRAAAGELAGLTGARAVSVDRRLSLMWFSMSLRPAGWSLPSIWDPIAGDYRAADGWIRLHTNAPHHRHAALQVLDCAGDRESVSAAVAARNKDELEAAIVAVGGAAAAMRSLEEWRTHPQGQAVAAEPLIQWRDIGQGRRITGVAGLRVLDLTRVLAGPVATRFLAGFGADVLRIDPPDWNEPAVEPEVTVGKRRAGLDLHRADDRRTFEALLSKADVLVHGYRPGALEKLGYGDEERQRLSPGLIDVCLDAYGWTGPWAGRRGFDSLVQMSCGIADEGMTRSGGAQPVPLPVQALDHATGYLIAAAVLRALRHAQATGTRFSARLSLARTAALLTGAGARPFQGSKLEDRDADLAPALEQTSWGPARRLTFPVRVDGRGPEWALPAGLLRIDAARW